MANLIEVVLIISCVLVATPSALSGEQADKTWFHNICQGNENVAKLHFYVQDVFGGANITAYEVARAPITSNSPAAFGRVVVADQLLTAEPDINSEEVGRGQGLVTSADLETPAVAMVINFVFTSGNYNGSTISILGRNDANSNQRELPVVGGTGMFRMARGFAITTTVSYDPLTNNYVNEYTLYVTYVDEASRALEAKF